VTNSTITFLAATATSAALTPLVRDAAIRWRLGHQPPSARSVHTTPIPRLGGLAIVVAFYAAVLVVALVSPGARQAIRAELPLALGLAGGGLVIAALGVYDDLRGANAKVKLAVQLLTALAMYALGYRIDEITGPWGGTLALGWLGLPITLLWIAGVVNAVNLIDGLDGLAGGVAFFAVATTFVTAFQQADQLMALAAAAMAGAVLGFLRYNFNPATVFMGDTGSMFLGFVLAVTALHTHQKSSATLGIAVPLLALGVPLADTLLAIGRRALRGAPIFSADRGHIHHRLLDRGLSHRQAVLVLYACAGTLAAVALATSYLNSTQGFALLLAVAVIGWIGLRTLGFLDLARTGEVLATRRRALELRSATSWACARVRQAATPDGLQVALREGAARLGASAVALTPGRPGPAAWSEGFGASGEDLLRARFTVGAEGTLELGWTDGRAQLDRPTEVAVEQLLEAVAASLERLAPPTRTVA
jgi:UDP-GlcNAc:undecaprenyl-phosphate GlcNAc-1-phosphate transferase